MRIRVSTRASSQAHSSAQLCRTLVPWQFTARNGRTTFSAQLPFTVKLLCWFPFRRIPMAINVGILCRYMSKSFSPRLDADESRPCLLRFSRLARQQIFCSARDACASCSLTVTCKPQPGQTAEPIVIDLRVDLRDLRMPSLSVEQIGTTIIPVHVIPPSGGRVRV